MPYYRKKRDADTWHWCEACADWPRRDFVELWYDDGDRPPNGELCNHCKFKEETREFTT